MYSTLKGFIGGIVTRMNDMEKYREKIKVISFDREKNQMVEVEESKITF